MTKGKPVWFIEWKQKCASFGVHSELVFGGQRRAFSLRSSQSQEGPSCQSGFWGSLPGTPFLQHFRALTPCRGFSVHPALCLRRPTDGLSLFPQGSSTSWPPPTPAPTLRTDRFTNLLTHRGELWSHFLLRCIHISPYLHG